MFVIGSWGGGVYVAPLYVHSFHIHLIFLFQKNVLIWCMWSWISSVCLCLQCEQRWLYTPSLPCKVWQPCPPCLWWPVTLQAMYSEGMPVYRGQTQMHTQLILMHFLFTLKQGNQQAYMKFPATNVQRYTTAICSGTNQGPWFGSTNGYAALQFVTTNNAVTKTGNYFTCPDLSVEFTYGFQNNGQHSNVLWGGNNQLINIEVYTVKGKLSNENSRVW